MFSTDLGEIPNQVAASVVSLGHDVEEEGFNIVIKGFVVQEKLCQQTQVLTVDLGTKKRDAGVYCSGISQMWPKPPGKGQKKSESSEKWWGNRAAGSGNNSIGDGNG